MAQASPNKSIGGVDGDVVHEGLAGVHARQESSVDADVSVFGFDEPVVHCLHLFLGGREIFQPRASS